MSLIVPGAVLLSPLSLYFVDIQIISKYKYTPISLKCCLNFGCGDVIYWVMEENVLDLRFKPTVVTQTISCHKLCELLKSKICLVFD